MELFQNSPRSLFQRTLSRVPNGPDILPPLVVGNIQHHELIRNQIGDSGARVILEPAARNTAPAIAIAAHWAAMHAPDATLVVMPSDHMIGNFAAFQEDVSPARGIADAGNIVVFGVTPDRFETGFGYIQLGKKFEVNGTSACHVEAFIEKPDLATAQGYYEDGSKFWNSGIFVFSAATMLVEFERLAPEIFDGSAAALRKAETLDSTLVLPQREYEKIESISLDYAIMEKTRIAAMVRFSSPWRDLGSTEMLKSFSTSPVATTDPLSPDVQAFLDAND
jgi:mannose-1-phosphate guanylyltransferase/mannose-6-phosphate isomerase